MKKQLLVAFYFNLELLNHLWHKTYKHFFLYIAIFFRFIAFFDGRYLKFCRSCHLAPVKCCLGKLAFTERIFPVTFFFFFSGLGTDTERPRLRSCLRIHMDFLIVHQLLHYPKCWSSWCFLNQPNQICFANFWVFLWSINNHILMFFIHVAVF